MNTLILVLLGLCAGVLVGLLFAKLLHNAFYGSGVKSDDVHRDTFTGWEE